MTREIAIFWFRRDLRLDDNVGLTKALQSNNSVLPIFIFDENILQKLSNPYDARVTFIYEQITQLKIEFEKRNSTLLVHYGNPLTIFKNLVKEYNIKSVYSNEDYEPYSIKRDQEVKDLLADTNIAFYQFTDQVIMPPGKVMKNDETPYTVFTPYSKKWKSLYNPEKFKEINTKELLGNLYSYNSGNNISLEDLGFKRNCVSFPSSNIDFDIIHNYEETRDIPSIKGTTRLGLHLRFGTISIRKLTKLAYELSEIYLNELIWRNFFMDILLHYPYVVNEPFKPKYKFIQWRNNEANFKRWCEGKTGYPLVDAGMRELSETGFMHNRVRMVCAGFLTKHLLIKWQWGEAYFAEKLLDFDLSANNGNWQWAAGCGCDAAPYFRIFNPIAQQQKFDKEELYVRKWVPEYGTIDYVQPMIDHKKARLRALDVYKKGLSEVK